MTREPAEPPAALFAWDEAMTIGLGVLRLTSKAFWSMTPREFAAATGVGIRQRTAPGRSQLEALEQRYPDKPKGHEIG